MAIKDTAEKTTIKTKVRNAVKKSDRLEACYEAFDYTFKNPQKAKPLIALALKRLFSRKRYIFLPAAPTHANRGDQMIVLAMKKWCEKYLPEYGYLELDDSILDEWFCLSLLKFAVKKHDMIFLRGGGSVGDWYLYYENFIRQVLKIFVKNKIVMFPQTVNFSGTPKGREEKDRTSAAYDSHPDFTLVARDEASFSAAQDMFRRAKVRLCPDIALYLCRETTLAPAERTGVLFCFRPDANETYYSEEERLQIIDAVKKRYEIKFGDTSAGYRIPAGEREQEVIELLRLFAGSKAAVTDRYHGIISAVITGTPVVALRSAGPKIVSGIKWLEDLDFVFYAETVEAVPGLIEKALQRGQAQVPDFSHYYDRLFEDIANG